MTDEIDAEACAKTDAANPDNPNSKNKERERIVDKLIKIAINQSEGNHPDAGGLFHAPNSVAYADIRIGHRRETWPIRSRGFHQWLVRVYYEINRTAPNSEALKTAIGLAEARAVIDGPEREVFVRTGAYGGKLYLDLANENWEAIEIGASGWRIVTNPPVRFRRSAGMRPLRRPVHGGSIEALRSFLNVSSQEEFVVAVCWILAALRNTGPYPVLALSGEQGSAKSTFAILLRYLIDPNVASLRSLPREERDLAISANNAHVLAFDNVSHLSPWISDALCRIATGAGFATRQLYTDMDEVLLDASRPVILTGIVDVVTRADLADRALAIKLEPIEETKRRSERDLMAAFWARAPEILGALLDGMVHGIRDLPKVNLQSHPRLADFAEWATACEAAFWPPGTFMKAYESNRHHLNEVALDADLVGTAIEAMMATRVYWAGNPASLLRSLNQIADESQTRSKEWPVNANQLGRSLRRCAPLLRRAGIDVHFAVGGKRTITLRRLTENERKSSPSSPTHSATEEKPNDFNQSGHGETKGDRRAMGGTREGRATPRASPPGSYPLNDCKKGDTGDTGDTLRPRSVEGRDDGIPASLRRCAHCNKNGELGHVALGDRPTVWLHRECEAAWRKRMTITPIPPHSPQLPIDDAAGTHARLR
jgi:hypothetical protein